jgi:hypothetical protein
MRLDCCWALRPERRIASACWLANTSRPSRTNPRLDRRMAPLRTARHLQDLVGRMNFPPQSHVLTGCYALRGFCYTPTPLGISWNCVQIASARDASGGGESSDTPAVCVDGAADRVVAPARRIERPKTEGHQRRDCGGGGKVSETSVNRGLVPTRGGLRRAKTGPLCGQWRDGAALTRIAVAFGAGQMYVAGRRRNPKWKSPLESGLKGQLAPVYEAYRGSLAGMLSIQPGEETSGIAEWSLEHLH